MAPTRRTKHDAAANPIFRTRRRRRRRGRAGRVRPLRLRSVCRDEDSQRPIDAPRLRPLRPDARLPRLVRPLEAPTATPTAEATLRPDLFSEGGGTMTQAT